MADYSDCTYSGGLYGVGEDLCLNGNGDVTVCTPWITGDDVMACCSVESSSGTLFDEVAEQASDLLFEMSGRLYPGTCSKTARPHCDPCWCGYQVLSRGHIVGPWDYGYQGWGYWNWCGYCLLNCSPSRVKLSGYRVQDITEVKIDGVVLANTEYRLDFDRYLTRLNNQRWPILQNFTLPDTENGTWSITYTYGDDPPALGVSAAAQLACELYKACSGADCALPSGVTSYTRQGIRVEKAAFTSWAYQKETRLHLGGWRTGMNLVDAFLASVNPRGMQRRPTFWSPARTQGIRYAPRVP